MLANLVRSTWRAWRRERFNRALAKIYGPCPHCERLILGHRVALVGAIRPSLPGSREQELRTLIENRDWIAAREIDEFDALDDAIIIEAVRCPDNGQWALFEFHSFFDLGDKDRAEVLTTIASDQAPDLESALAGRLRPFGEAAIDATGQIAH